MSSEVWIEKYRPEVFSEIVGNREAISLIKLTIDDDYEKKPILLHGNPGVGKTTLAYVIANEMNLEPIELNASAQRTAGVIKKVVGVASDNKSFDDRKKLIILDEADNLHGNSDRGGAKEIINIVKNAKQSIILTCNELYKISYPLRSICTVVELKNISKTDIFIVLSKISEKENLNVGVKVLDIISKNANGDLRMAINDLQSNLSDNMNLLKEADLILSKKHGKDNIFKTLQNITQAPNISETYASLLNCEKNPEELVQWVEQNLSLVFNNKNDLVEAYEKVSKADMFIGRVRRRQNYKMWKHSSVMLSCVNSICNNSSAYTKGGFIRFQGPQHWKILKNNSKIRNTNKKLFIKLSNNYHVSGKRIPTEILPFLIKIMQTNSLKFCIENELTKDEISWMLFQKLTNNKNKDKNDIINELFEMSQHDIKINKAEEISNTLDSDFDMDSIGNSNKKVKKSKEELKRDKLSKGQFSLADF